MTTTHTLKVARKQRRKRTTKPKNPLAVFEQRSLPLTKQEWQTLDYLAAATGSVPKSGRNTKTPTWRNLIKRIAQGEFLLIATANAPALAVAFSPSVPPIPDPAQEEEEEEEGS